MVPLERAKEIKLETGVKSDVAFCLGSSVEKTNSVAGCQFCRLCHINTDWRVVACLLTEMNSFVQKFEMNVYRFGTIPNGATDYVLKNNFPDYHSYMGQ